MVRVGRQRPHSYSVVRLAGIAAWMRSNRLQLNTAKTDVIWCSSTRRQHQIPQRPLVVGSEAVVPVRVVRDLGIYLDSDLMMRTRVTKTVSSCFAVLRQLRSIRRSVSDPVLQSLVVALVLTKLYYTAAPHWQDCLPFSFTGCSRCCCLLLFSSLSTIRAGHL